MKAANRRVWVTLLLWNYVSTHLIRMFIWCIAGVKRFRGGDKGLRDGDRGWTVSSRPAPLPTSSLLAS